MIGSFSYSGEEPKIRCAICDRRVTLELSKTDEEGNAVHEECYVRVTIASVGMPITDGEKIRRGWASALLGWALIAFPAASLPDSTMLWP